MISAAGRLLLAAARVEIVSANSGSGLRRICYHGAKLGGEAILDTGE
jgi:hypothetical protein